MSLTLASGLGAFWSFVCPLGVNVTSQVSGGFSVQSFLDAGIFVGCTSQYMKNS